MNRTQDTRSRIQDSRPIVKNYLESTNLLIKNSIRRRAIISHPSSTRPHTLSPKSASCQSASNENSQTDDNNGSNTAIANYFCIQFQAHWNAFITAPHVVECNPIHTKITISNLHLDAVTTSSYHSSIFVSGVHGLRHGQNTRHCCAHIEPRLIEMMHPLNMLEKKRALPNCFAPDLRAC